MQFVGLVALCSSLAQAAGWPMTGWGSYRNYDLYNLRPGDETHQFSSYDHNNHNDDGFDGTFSCQRMEGSRCVIAEHNGPGEIESMWFTYDPDSIARAGDIIVNLDGNDVLSGSIQDIVDGGKGAPFVWPFVGNTDDTNGGNVIKVPMSFSKSMLVSTSVNPHFHHVTFRQLPADAAPKTFDPTDKAQDVLSQFQAFGVRDPKSIAGGALAGEGEHVVKTIEDASGTVDLADKCGIISKLAVRLPNVLASSFVQDDGRAFGTDGGASSFTLKLDANNKICRLTRRIDKSIANQKVQVTVDGATIGTFDSGAAVDHVWGDQALEIPAAATNGKTSIKVATNCVSSSLDCNEFFYALHCQSKDGTWKAGGYTPGDDWTLMDVLNVGPNNYHDEAVHGYATSRQVWEGLRQFAYKDDMHSNDALPDITMTLTFDGKDTVPKVPVGSFFGPSLGKATARSLMLSVDSMIADGAWTSWFPMPFKEGASLTLSSADGKPLNATVDAVILPCDGEEPSSQAWGYFSTQHRRGPTTAGQLWTILSGEGPGVAYGVSHTFRGSILKPANSLEFLEGDEQVWLNRTTPGKFDSQATMLGTGTEDFYESGWYFKDENAENKPEIVPFAMPMTGLMNTGYAIPSIGCKGSCLSVYRHMIGDSQSFPEAGISFNIEHGPDGNNIPCEYETSAYFYK